MSTGMIVGLCVLTAGLVLILLIILEDRRPNTLPGTSGKLGALILAAMVAIALIIIGAITSLGFYLYNIL